MSLFFNYQPEYYHRPLITLRGGTVRFRPILAITVFGPGGGRAVDGLADTGSDDVVFPDWVAARIGLDLTNAPAGNSSGVNRGLIPVRYAEVGLRLHNPHEQRNWHAWVAFAPLPPRPALLGHAGFLEFFDAAFRHWRRELELTVAPTYPGT